MKSFLYSLKVCMIVIPLTFVTFFAVVILGADRFDIFTIPVAFVRSMVYMLPFLLAVWISAAVLYKRDIPAKIKKRWVALWGFLAILLSANFIPLPPVWVIICLVCMTGAFVIALRSYPVPSRQALTVTDGLKGRHILLRVQENNLLLHGIILSELNIWPITVKLHDNSPNTTLELHSTQQDELFTSLGYQNSVKVKAFTQQQEFLFAATLELDHTLN